MTTISAQPLTQWVKIFPKQATENYASSVTLMKKLTVVAVSMITYLSNYLPEDCYEIEKLSGVKLHILKKKCRDEKAQFLEIALTKAFDAFDKKYLHQLALCFYEGEFKAENLVEYHIFEYNYKPEGVTLNVHSKNQDSNHTVQYSFENVMETTVQLISSCVVISEACSQELSKSCEVSLRLYYNEDAPANYQAPGYESTSEDHLEPPAHGMVMFGCVETPFHKMAAHSWYNKLMTASHEANPTQNPPSSLSCDTDPFGSAQRQAREVSMYCPCNKYGPADACARAASELLTCQYCKLQQHAACFGVLRDAVPRVSQHCCDRCYDSDASRTPTDTRLVSLSVRNRKCLCLFRRVLAWCLEVRSVEARDLVHTLNITDSDAQRFMTFLYSKKIIQQDPQSFQTKPQKIMSDQLKSAISKYFNTNEYKLVDRLLAESFASQESVADPISDVLSPLNTISLQNAANIARYVDKPIKITATNSKEMKEYRDAIMTDVESPERKKVGKRKQTDGQKIRRTGVKRSRIGPQL